MAFSMDVEVEEKARLNGHRWQLSDLEFNVDGTMLASASWDKEVRLWDLFTLDSVCVLKDQHSVPVTTLSWFPPDGSLIATGSADCTACLWSVDSGEMLVCLKEHFGWVMDSSFSENGSALATASWDKTIRVWDPATGSLMTTLNGHTKGVFSCHFHPAATSNIVCSASEDETVRIWDTRMQGNKPMRTLVGGHEDAVCCCRWSPDGRLIASGGADHRISVWDAREGKVISQLREHSDAVKALAFHPGTGPWQGKTMLASAGDTAVCLWDPSELAERDLLCHHTVHGSKDVEALAFTPDGTVLATGGRDNDIVLSFLSLPGDKGGEGELAWVKRQNEERARLQAIEDEERAAEELERKQQTDRPHESESDESTGNEDDDDYFDEDGEDEDGEVNEAERQSARPGDLPVEVQRRQLRHKVPVGRRSSAALITLRRQSIHGHNSSGLTSPRVLRSTLSLGMGVDADSAYALRTHRLLQRAVEIRSSVAYLGSEVTEHGEGCSEDDGMPDEEENVSGDEVDDEDDDAASGSSSSVTTVRVEAISVVSDETDGLSYEKTKTLTIGKLPDVTPRLAISMPASRTNSIHNFFAEPDPLPDRPASSILDEDAVMHELDLIIGDEDEEEEEDDIADVYGEPVLQYVAEPIRPPPEYLARQQKLSSTSATSSYGTILGSGPPPLAAIADGGRPPLTQRRPTHTLTKISAKPAADTPKRIAPTASSDSEDYEPISDEEQESYEGVEEARVPPSSRTAGTTAQKMSARNDSGISSNRASVNSHSSRASDSGKLAASSDSSTLKSLRVAGAAAAGVTGVGVASNPSPIASRQPSVKSQQGGSSPAMAGRRLPQPPPASAAARSPSPTSPTNLTAPSTPPQARSRPVSGDPTSPLVGSAGDKPPILTARPTISSRNAAPLPPGKPDSRAKVPFLDSLLEEEKYKSHSAPGSPASKPRGDVNDRSHSQTPPPTAASRPESSLPPPTAASRPLSTLSTTKPSSPPLLQVQDDNQEEYMDFETATLTRGKAPPPTAPREDVFESAMATDGYDVDDDDQQDEYMMFDANETSVI